MNRLQRTLLVTAGLTVGLLGVRRLRNRGTSEPTVEQPESEAVPEPESAGEHALVAVDHAGTALELLLEDVRAELESEESPLSAVSGDVEESDSASESGSRGRLTRVRPDWVGR